MSNWRRSDGVVEEYSRKYGCGRVHLTTTSVAFTAAAFYGYRGQRQPREGLKVAVIHDDNYLVLAVVQLERIKRRKTPTRTGDDDGSTG